MKLFVLPCGTALDLEHLLAIGPLLCESHYESDEDFDPEQTFEYTLSLAFNSKLTIIHDKKEQAEASRRRLLLAWEDRS